MFEKRLIQKVQGWRVRGHNIGVKHIFIEYIRAMECRSSEEKDRNRNDGV